MQFHMPQPWQIQLPGPSRAQDEGRGGRKPCLPWPLGSSSHPLKVCSSCLLKKKKIAFLPPLQPGVPGPGAAVVPCLSTCTINPLELPQIKSTRERSSSGEATRGMLPSFVWNISMHSAQIMSLCHTVPFFQWASRSLWKWFSEVMEILDWSWGVFSALNWGISSRERSCWLCHLPRSGGSQRKRNPWGRGTLQLGLWLPKRSPGKARRAPQVQSCSSCPTCVPATPKGRQRNIAQCPECGLESTPGCHLLPLLGISERSIAAAWSKRVSHEVW